MAKSFSDVASRYVRTSTGKADSRRKLIGAVRAAASRMALSDEDRHVIQEEVTGKASLSDMTLAEIGKVLDRLNRDRPAPMAHRGHIGKIRALWWSLYWLGAIDAPNDAALDSFVQRQTRISALRFVTHHQAPAVIEALKAMLAREGVCWRTPVQVAELPHRGERPMDQATSDRESVLAAIWSKLRTLNLTSGGYAGYAAKILGAQPDPWSWSGHEFDVAIRELGKRLRRALDKRAVE